MAGSLGLGIALLIIGLLGLLFFPWGGIIVAIIGLLLIIAFVAGFGRRATEPRPRG
jgi:membrane protein implicated in regulation of membrane protease activity